MPYTPPSRRSPSTSSPNSPALSRNHSYDAHVSHGPHPKLPRSRSAVYLHKHRRTPSLATNRPQLQLSGGSSHSDGTSPVVSGALLLHSKPLSEVDGLTESPVDFGSPGGSAEDDEERGRRLQILDLAETLRESMVVPKRRSSPTRNGQLADQALSAQKAVAADLKPSPLALTPEALKIAHSRSSSEIHITPQQSHSASQNSPGDSDEDGLEMKRLPMVRKKSGELVKPALRGASQRRHSSAPGTPTHPKAVHFNDNIEQVRHFLQVDRPMAVSAGSSPVETYDSESDYPFSSDEAGKRVVGLEIRLANFPKDSHERQCLPVRVEQLSLSKDNKSLLGLVAVANIAFNKFVTARFTLDYWKTTSEVAAEYYNVRSQKQPSDAYDRFQFSIKLSEQANLQNKTMYICVRYNVNGQEHWDNNFGNNYQIDFIRKLVTKQWAKAPPGVMAIPRSRNTGGARLPRPKSFPAGTSDDEFSTSYESPFRLQQSDSAQRRNQAQLLDTAQHHATGSARLSNRYDFNASLHAALATAQNALGEKSGLRLKTSHTKRPAQAVTPELTVQHVSTNHRLSRPDLNSAEYKDLIQKFCYFGSSGNNTAVVSPDSQDTTAKTMNSQTDGKSLDLSSGSNDSSANSSASNSPPTPKAQLHQSQDQSSDSIGSSRSTPMRAVSPRLLPYRAPSPAVNSAYQEFPHQGLSVQSAQC